LRIVPPLANARMTAPFSSLSLNPPSDKLDNFSLFMDYRISPSLRLEVFFFSFFFSALSPLTRGWWFFEFYRIGQSPPLLVSSPPVREGKLLPPPPTRRCKFFGPRRTPPTFFLSSPFCSERSSGFLGSREMLSFFFPLKALLGLLPPLFPYRFHAPPLPLNTEWRWRPP